MNDLTGITAWLGDKADGKMDIQSFRGARSIEEKRKALKESSKEFEAVFIHQMISAMRKTVGESSLMPKSNGQKIFEGMLDEEWAKKLASKSGPSSLGDILYRQLSARLGLEEGENGGKVETQWPLSPPVTPLDKKNSSHE